MHSTLGKTSNLLILGVILILGLGLRLFKLDAYGIFFDEKSTMVVSQGVVLEGANQKEVFANRNFSLPEFWQFGYGSNPARLIQSFTYKESPSVKSFTPKEFWKAKSKEDYYEAMTRSDIGNSPFYYLSLHYWMDAFGLSDYSARLFSVVFSVLIILLTYFFGKRFFSPSIGLISAGIVAIEPFFIAYSQQARNYSLTFFLTLLATYLLLQIIEGEQKGKSSWKLYVLYGVVAGLSLLSHFLVISVLLAHGIYALFFLKPRKWPYLIGSGIIALSGITWWLVWGGGQWTLKSLAYQAEAYKKAALNNPLNNPYGAILPATLSNVFNKSLPIFSDLYFFSNGLTDSLEGKKFAALAILIGLLWITIYQVWKRTQIHALLYIPAVSLLVSIPVYSNHPLQFGIFSVAVFTLSFLPGIYLEADSTLKRRLWLLYLMALIPTLFLILMSFKNGHTYGLTQRYSGFSFPFVIILFTLTLQKIYSTPRWFSVPVAILLVFQIWFVQMRLLEVYEDRSAKYNYRTTPRVSNPHYEAAQLIKAGYSVGDTVFYPAPASLAYESMDKTYLPYEVRDAQLTNLYLPKDALYTQVMDTVNTDAISLKKKGESIKRELVNLKGIRY